MIPMDPRGIIGHREALPVLGLHFHAKYIGSRGFAQEERVRLSGTMSLVNLPYLPCIRHGPPPSHSHPDLSN